MGQKSIHRLPPGGQPNWASRVGTPSNRDFAGMLAEDIKVREYLKPS